MALSKTLVCLFASIGAVVSVTTGSRLAGFAGGLAAGDESSTARRYAVEALRLAASMMSGWSIAAALAAVFGLIGVITNHQPSIRLFAMASVADATIWSLVVLSSVFILFNPAWSAHLNASLCEELTSGELFVGSVDTPAISSLFFKRNHDDTSRTSFDVSGYFGGSLEQCVEHVRPALASLVLLAVVLLIVRIRVAAFVYNHWRQTQPLQSDRAFSEMSTPVMSRTSSVVWKGKGRETDEEDETDVETSGTKTPVPSSSRQFLAVPASSHGGKRA